MWDGFFKEMAHYFVPLSISFKCLKEFRNKGDMRVIFLKDFDEKRKKKFKYLHSLSSFVYNLSVKNSFDYLNQSNKKIKLINKVKETY